MHLRALLQFPLTALLGSIDGIKLHPLKYLLIYQRYAGIALKPIIMLFDMLAYLTQA